ncbi:transglycosylase domain-containing protein [Pontibacter oryzae]|uniref:peptidoglycan glycosyltransferase n=1 Tax=Pontibacter oryzae TaxID=2304593 RepID=A0A399SGV1_9BACT|nr:transglycosylase domain-containing protein [Pontibacter oryzae]RIJ42049.1 hypothetical protein D1627_08620 [Pontibacter oryzae]
MVLSNYLITSKDSKSRFWPIIKWIFIGILCLVVGAAITVVVYEIHTSRLQARELSRYAATLTYTVKDGAASAVVYPKSGPFDRRLGYALLPELLDRATKRGMQVQRQAHFSDALTSYALDGYFPPYIEKTQAGLFISDSKGEPFYHYRYPQRLYDSYAYIPSVLVNTLLFIENRELLAYGKPYMNPAIDWKRFAKASMYQAGQRVGLKYKTIGGSTLATQIEKFRHSPEGITEGPQQKLQQMASASVRAYQRGPETLPVRRDLVLCYLNTVPLSGAPGYGEVHGLGDGLWVWFATDFDEFNRLLHTYGATGATLGAQGQALRQAISLMIAQRRPSYYLSGKGRAELNVLTAGYLRLLARNGYISDELRDAGLANEVKFRDFSRDPVVSPKETEKGTLMVRTHLAGMLGKPLYDLDRMDLSVSTTIQGDLQEQVSAYLDKLNEPAFAGEAGIIGARMLTERGAREVKYSFTLIEQSPQGNLVRVQTDNTNQPFDLNEGSKLELGSTAKLRVLVTYLEAISEIHSRYQGKPKHELRAALQASPDNLSRFVLNHLLYNKDQGLTKTLYAALERRYSASPHEAFFTGGGLHRFHNFQSKDNGRRPTIREAFLNSINLPFVRLMRDIVQYTTYQQVENTPGLLGNERDPRRINYLNRFAHREGQVYLRQFWNKYKGLNEAERFDKLITTMRRNQVRLGAVHRYLYPETDSVAFGDFLKAQLPQEKLSDKRRSELYHMYGPDAFSLPDQGYITKVHPLELWLLRYLKTNPATTWATVAKEGQLHIPEIYKWLFRTRFKHARDSRIRTMLELDAFVDIQEQWSKLGYPFSSLVPSLATALGSSGDRPEALAELVGIVLNNGVRLPNIRINQLHFAADTPYETLLARKAVTGDQVLHPEIAAIMKKALHEVVNQGTARRLQEGFDITGGNKMVLGGKTGTGDNRFITRNIKGHRIASRAVNRTATFVFFIGDKHYGTLTAFVPGQEAANFSFTSSLPVQVLKSMAPIIEPYLQEQSDSLKVNTATVASLEISAEFP